jgi:hypothetical protein
LEQKIGKIVIVPPKEFFQFCARHVGLLRELEQRASGTDLSESEISEITNNHSVESGEQSAFLFKRLKELRILVSADQSEQYFLMAEPVRGILRYLLEEAKPASAETVQSYVNELQKLAQKLRDALNADDPTIADLALSDITQTLRRLHDDVTATQVSVIGEGRNTSASSGGCSNILRQWLTSSGWTARCKRRLPRLRKCWNMQA